MCQTEKTAADQKPEGVKVGGVQKGAAMREMEEKVREKGMGEEGMSLLQPVGWAGLIKSRS